MDHRFRNVVIALILAAGILLPVWLWMRPVPSATDRNPAVPQATPTRGTLIVALDRALLPVATTQSQRFSEAYPDASITLSAGASQPLLQLLRSQAGGALIEGALTGREDSLMTSLQRPVRRQPVARNALVCVVSRTNPIRSLSVDQLKDLFSGKTTDWQSLGGRTGRIVACLDGSDPRVQVLLSELLFGRTLTLSASAEPDQTRLLDRIRDDRNAMGVITLPAWAEALRSGKYDGTIRSVPLVARKGGKAVEAAPETLYSGHYPLSTTVFYLYDPYDPLATGFGAWLAKEGQKLFERGDLAPYEQLVRTIIIR